MNVVYGLSVDYIKWYPSQVLTNFLFFFIKLIGEYIQLPLQLDDAFLEEALQLSELDSDVLEIDDVFGEDKTITEDNQNLKAEDNKLKPPSEVELNLQSIDDVNLNETIEIEDLLCTMMIQSSTGPFQHPRAVSNYGHGVHNSFRSASYHHQVCEFNFYSFDDQSYWIQLEFNLSFKKITEILPK